MLLTAVPSTPSTDEALDEMDDVVKHLARSFGSTPDQWNIAGAVWLRTEEGQAHITTMVATLILALAAGIRV